MAPPGRREDPSRRRHRAPGDPDRLYGAVHCRADGSLAQLAKAHSEGRLEERLAFFARPKLLIVDELGYLPFEPDAAHLFFQLVSRRYERGSMLITSNARSPNGARSSVTLWWRPPSSTDCCTTATLLQSAATATACARSGDRERRNDTAQGLQRLCRHCREAIRASVI